MRSDFQSEKQAVIEMNAAIEAASASAVGDALAEHTTSDYRWRGFHPFNEIRGAQAVAEQFWRPIKTALRPLQRRLDVFIAGRNWNDDGATVWVMEMGHLLGLFDAHLLGVQPTGRLGLLRYAAFHRVADGRIAETALYCDLPHLFRQAGVILFPTTTAADLVQPGPMTHHGVHLGPTAKDEGEATHAAIQRMLTDLGNWDCELPLEEELRRSWHEDMLWWGPTGIGATYTIERYAKQHSGVFRAAFGERQFNGHVATIAEGHFGGFFGWPNLTLLQTSDFMGRAPSGKRGDMRVIDVYRRAGDKLAENWIFIDFLHFYMSQGIDILQESGLSQ